jgi:sRNA-binding regulator protein Hfq
MGNNTPNPYWQKAIQYQQGHQPQPQGRQQPRGKVQVQEDFSGDWRRKRVITKVAEGTNVNTIEGVVEDVSRYWIKLRVGNEVIYVNKAHIISIKFAEVKEPVGGSNANK